MLNQKLNVDLFYPLHTFQIEYLLITVCLHCTCSKQIILYIILLMSYCLILKISQEAILHTFLFDVGIMNFQKFKMERT